MAEILVRAGFVLLYALLFSFLILTVLGLAGNWILVAAAVILRLAGAGDLTWTWVFVAVGLATLGEIVEALLGLVVVARKGGTRRGVMGSFIGGIAGAVVGAPVAPPLGALALGFVGAFAGAAVGEYLRNRRTEEALRIGFWAFVGRAAAAAVKVAAGMGIIGIIIVRTW